LAVLNVLVTPDIEKMTFLSSLMKLYYYWIIGLLDYWIIGLLDYWIIGLLDYWIIGLLEITFSNKATNKRIHPL